MKPGFAVLIASVLLTAGFAAKAEDAPAPAGDVPGLGEIMTLQQLRHIKLWFAGRAGNWPLADYEVGELNEGFEDVSKLARQRHSGQNGRRSDQGAAEGGRREESRSVHGRIRSS